MLQFFLLLILGFNGAVYLVLGEMLVIDGYHGFTSAVLHALGSAVSLTVACLISGTRLRWTPICLQYYVVCAFLGLIGPAVSTFWVIPYIGTGLMAAVIATSPLFTVLFSHLLRVEVFDRRLFTGIMIGFLGAAIIILAEVSWPSEPDKYLWLCMSLIVPAFLASGNVARTALWPENLTPPQAGAGISWAAIVFAVPLVFLFEPTALSGSPATSTLWIMAAFVFLNGISAFPYFFLQRSGGPTLLSLLSHVMAGFGLLLGALWFGETYRASDLFGVVLILIGVSAANYFKSLHRNRSEPEEKHTQLSFPTGTKRR